MKRKAGTRRQESSRRRVIGARDFVNEESYPASITLSSRNSFFTERTEVQTEDTESNTLSALCPLWAGLRALCAKNLVNVRVKCPGYGPPFPVFPPRIHARRNHGGGGDHRSPGGAGAAGVSTREAECGEQARPQRGAGGARRGGTVCVGKRGRSAGRHRWPAPEPAECGTGTTSRTGARPRSRSIFSRRRTRNCGTSTARSTTAI